MWLSSNLHQWFSPVRHFSGDSWFPDAADTRVYIQGNVRSYVLLSEPQHMIWKDNIYIEPKLKRRMEFTANAWVSYLLPVIWLENSPKRFDLGLVTLPLTPVTLTLDHFFWYYTENWNFLYIFLTWWPWPLT